MVKKEQAIAKLEALKKLGSGFKDRLNFGSPEFKRWQLSTQTALEEIFPHRMGHVHRFNSLNFTAGPYSAATKAGSSERAFQHGIEEAGAILDSMIEEIQDYWAETGPSNSNKVGTHVFIGHGHSTQWTELKDFIQDRLKLAWDEFNRVSPAGIPHAGRLSQMLDNAAIAFIVMTAEDETADGTRRARENVVHEAGLFQGRLGFKRAIVLREEGCGEFSNITGLGQIPFPKQNIKAVFEEIRKVLERESLIESK